MNTDAFDFSKGLSWPESSLGATPTPADSEEPLTSNTPTANGTTTAADKEA